MKRARKALIIVAGILAALALSAFALYEYTFGDLAPISKNDVLPGVHVVAMGFVSAFLVDAGPGEVVLIDTGVDPDAREILAALQARQLGPQAVRAIFITHGHSDHIAGVRAFPNALVFALDDERPLVAGEIAPSSPLGKLQSPKPTGIVLTRGLSDGERVQVGPLDVRVFAVPGHTRGSAAFLARDTLFVGDAASLTTKGNIKGPMWLFSENAPEGMQSLRLLGARLRDGGVAVKALAFAHSGPLVADGAVALAGMH